MPHRTHTNPPTLKARDLGARFGWILCAFLLVSLAKAERLPVKTYTTADGLQRDDVWCIRQDSRGFLWFLTLFRQFAPPPNADYQLTPQEKEILKMLTEGHSYKTAAQQLNLSYHTISFHLRNVYEKLQVHSMSEAVAKALREKLV